MTSLSIFKYVMSLFPMSKFANDKHEGLLPAFQTSTKLEQSKNVIESNQAKIGARAKVPSMLLLEYRLYYQ